MKTLCLIALVLACTMALQNKRPLTNAQIHKYESIKHDNKWASIMLNLAELHIQAQGPFDELIEAIHDVISDNERKTEKAHADYDKRTNEHEAEVARINGQIDTANEDIARTTELLENVLFVQKANLESDIVQLNQNIVDTQEHIVNQTNLRNSNHAKFLVAVEEHEEALAAVSEALGVLNQLFEGASLIQVKKAQKSIEKVQTKLGNNVQSSLVKALLALANNQFSDQSDVQKVADLLNEVNSNLVASLAQYNDNETRQQAEYEADMAQSENNISQFQIELTEKTELLAQTETSIAENQEFLALRQRHLVEYQENLVTENANFDRITELYEELVAQLQTERSACQEALSVLEGGDVAGYIGDRITNDSPLADQPHGMGITVESDPFDLE